MDYITIIGIAIVGVALTLFGFRRRSDAKAHQLIQNLFNDRGLDAARAGIEDALDSDTAAIDDDLNGDSPARDLAARGNTRSREKKS
jgi:type II secretory pathway pseudopilin PulG|tara:strand:+ start:1527 stop:1787 length:261 start_codon:yes stop_codon:yes gene_type:complete